MRNITFFLFGLLISSLSFAQTSTLSNYQFRESNELYESISDEPNATGLFGSAWDSGVEEVNLGFTFNFDQTDYTTCFISAEGFITFGTAPAANTTRAISGTETYAGAVAGYSSNLSYGTSGQPIFYATIGTAPNRVFVAEYKDVSRPNFIVYRGDVMNFQIRLHESSNKVSLHYGISSINNETVPITGQIGLRGSSVSHFTNRRDLGGGIGNTAYGTLATNAVTTSPTTTIPVGTMFEWTPCSTCVTKYWAGNGSPLANSTTGLDFNDPANWSISGPAGDVVATTAPEEGDSLVVNGSDIFTLSSNVKAKSILHISRFVDLGSEIAVGSKTLELTGSLTMDVVGTAGENVRTVLSVGTDATSEGTLIVGGKADLGNYSINTGAKSVIRGKNSPNTIVDFKGGAVFGDKFEILTSDLVGQTFFTGANSKVSFVYTTGQLTARVNFNDVIFGNGTDVAEVTCESFTPANTSILRVGGELRIKSNARFNIGDEQFDAVNASANDFVMEPLSEISVSRQLDINNITNFPKGYAALKLDENSTQIFEEGVSDVDANIHFGNVIYNPSSTELGAFSGVDTTFIAGSLTVNGGVSFSALLCFDGSGYQTIDVLSNGDFNELDRIVFRNTSTDVNNGIVLTEDLNYGELYLDTGSVNLNGHSVIASNNSMLFTHDVRRNIGFFYNDKNDFSGNVVVNFSEAREHAIPFGTSVNDVSLLKLEHSAGRFELSAYSTGADNSPLPQGINSLPRQGGSDVSDILVDRFYLVKKYNSGDSYTGKISFGFAGSEKPASSDDLEVFQFNGTDWGTALVTVQDEDTCIVDGTFDNRIFAISNNSPVPLVADFTADLTTVCAGSTIEFQNLSTGAITDYNWTINGGTPSTSQEVSPTVVFSTPGTYTIELTITDGVTTETVVKTDFIVVHELPTAEMTGESVICEGDLSTMSVELTGNGPWDIVVNDGANDLEYNEILTSPFEFTVSDEATYTLVSVEDEYCNGSAIGTVNVSYNPELSISNITENCDGDQFSSMFTFIGGDQNSYYVSGISGSFSGGTFTSDQIPSGFYSFEVSDAYGCDVINYSATVTCIAPCEATAEITEYDVLCSGKSSDILVEFEGEAPFGFTFSDGLSNYNVENIQSDTYTITTTVSGNYSLMRMNDNSCEGSVDEEVIFLPETATPTVNVDDLTICEGTEAQAIATVDLSGGVFEWFNGDNGFTTIVSPTVTSTFHVDYALNGCSARAEFTVEVDPAPSQPSIGFDGVSLRSTPAQNYQWYLNGIAMPGETDIDHLVQQNGTYTVVVNDGKCYSPSSLEFAIDNLRIGENELSNHLKVYPNPSEGLYNIELSDALLNELSEISIQDAFGQQVMRMDIVSGQQIDLSHLAAGMYFMKLSTSTHPLVYRLIKK